MRRGSAGGPALLGAIAEARCFSPEHGVAEWCRIYHLAERIR